MAREFQRGERVADFIQQELAVLISREVRDPRVGLVDVTGVEVSRDLSHARVFVTFPGRPQSANNQADEQHNSTSTEERVEVLNGASGYIRSKLAKNSTMRFTPKLKFVFDESIERGSYLTRLIDNVVEDDQRRSAEAGGSGPSEEEPEQ